MQKRPTSKPSSLTFSPGNVAEEIRRRWDLQVRELPGLAAPNEFFSNKSLSGQKTREPYRCCCGGQPDAVCNITAEVNFRGLWPRIQQCFAAQSAHQRGSATRLYRTPHLDGRVRVDQSCPRCPVSRALYRTALSVFR